MHFTTAQAAAHAARLFVQKMDDSHTVVKLDFSNTFNSDRRDKMLEEVESLAPNIHPFVYPS